jgi:hypothetical protein
MTVRGVRLRQRSQDRVLRRSFQNHVARAQTIDMNTVLNLFRAASLAAIALTLTVQSADAVASASSAPLLQVKVDPRVELFSLIFRCAGNPEYSQVQFEGAEAGRRAAQAEASRGFAWTSDLAGLLGEYEARRNQYPTLDSFAPRLVEFFTRYAEDFDKQQNDLAAQRPQVVSMIPANGANDVAPDLSEIKVVFDRPMRDRSWAMCGSGPNYPETSGQPRYDAARITWTVPVKLKPNWSYEFWLNAGQFDSFRSAEGVPLASVHVTFKTAAR